MLFNRPVNYIVSTAMTAETKAVLASGGVIDGTRRGRHTITVSATADTYIGGEDLTSDNGLKVAAGETFTMPVDPNMSLDNLNYIGTCVLVEYF